MCSQLEVGEGGKSPVGGATAGGKGTSGGRGWLSLMTGDAGRRHYTGCGGWRGRGSLPGSRLPWEAVPVLGRRQSLGCPEDVSLASTLVMSCFSSVVLATCWGAAIISLPSAVISCLQFPTWWWLLFSCDRALPSELGTEGLLCSSLHQTSPAFSQTPSPQA